MPIVLPTISTRQLYRPQRQHALPIDSRVEHGRTELIRQRMSDRRRENISLALFLQLDQGGRLKPKFRVRMDPDEFIPLGLPDGNSEQKLLDPDCVGIGGIKPQALGIEWIWRRQGLFRYRLRKIVLVIFWIAKLVVAVHFS